MKIFNFFIETLYPHHCIYCKKELGDKYLCNKCFNDIKILKEQVCPVCERSSVNGNTHKECQKNTPLNGVFVITSYKDKIAHKIIHAYKYKFIKIFWRSLFLILIKGVESSNAFKGITTDSAMITSVPLHSIRHRWRGFNQSELIAKNLAEYLGIPYRNLIMRAKNSTPQKDISHIKDRQKNIKDTFKLINDPLGKHNLCNSHKTIIIIDDITTTLSTLNECAKTLTPLKPEKIYAIVIARNI